MLRKLWRNWTVIHRWWKCRMVQLFWFAVWQFLEELNIVLPHDPDIPLLDIYPREKKNMSTQKLAHSCS